MSYLAKDIVRINFKVNDLQLFSICINYGFDFRRLQELKNFGRYLWINLNEKKLLFYGNDNIILVADHTIEGYTSKELKMLRKMQALTPTRIKKDLKTASAYLELIEDFPSLKMESMDNFIKNNLIIVGDSLENNINNPQQETKTARERSDVILNLDAILDKINELGIDSLTREEKKFLRKF